jgi:periplasmic divalent cation tolerance protein
MERVVEIVQVQFTVGDERRAAALVTRLLEARLIACGQLIGPITSRYWWKGALEEAIEWICLTKTTLANVDDITSVVRQHHPDEVPEVIALPVVAGLDDYLAWVQAEVRGSQAATPGQRSSGGRG